MRPFTVGALMPLPFEPRRGHESLFGGRKWPRPKPVYGWAPAAASDGGRCVVRWETELLDGSPRGAARPGRRGTDVLGAVDGVGQGRELGEQMHCGRVE
jgi:hypothetical protein